MSLSEQQFETLARSCLGRIVDTILDQEDSDYDADWQGNNVVMIESEEKGQYILNLHTANRQIWVSSPISGASHFYYDDDSEEWRSTKNTDTTLAALLKNEIGIFL
jgi:frataxin